jgi:plastocyanin
MTLRDMVTALCAVAVTACSHHSPDSAPAPAPAPAHRDSAAPARVDSTRTDSAARETMPAPSAQADAAPPAAAADTQYLKYDAASKTVTFRLVAGPFAFNGFTAGGGTLTVPPGSNNVMNFEQNDGTPHSAEIDSGGGPLPNSGGNPAIPRAYTNKVVEGLPQGATDVMRFTAPDSGRYRIICGVPGHALSGMWIWYKVDPAAKTPTFGPTSKSP